MDAGRLASGPFTHVLFRLGVAAANRGTSRDSRETAIPAGAAARSLGSVMVTVKNLVLHIGVAKTGSTALQMFLHGQRELLARHGFHYPATREAGNGHMDFAKTFVHAPPVTMAMPADPDEVRRCMLAELEPVAGTVLISSEVFARAENPVEVRAWFPAVPAQVICYLRRQDRRAESQYNQLVKLKGETASFREFLPRIGLLDYRKLLDPWAEAFGPDAIVVRVYDRDRLPGRSIVPDFLRLIGVPPPPDVDATAGNPNPSLTPAGLALFRRLNAAPGGMSDADRRRFLAQPGIATAKAAPACFDPAERRAFLAGFADSNAHVARLYAGRPDGVLFDDEPSDEGLPP
jgi:hypothetical protein